VDPVFGPVVLVGDGGKYVEAMPDLQVLMAPFSAIRCGESFGSFAHRTITCRCTRRTTT
jgi:hypothetical protein